MDGVDRPLMVNHFPIIPVMSGTLAGIAALTVLAAGVTACAVLEGGEIVHDGPALEQGPPAGATAQAEDRG